MPLKEKIQDLFRLAFCMGADCAAGHNLICIPRLKMRHFVKFGASLSLKLQSSVVLSMAQDARTITRYGLLENSVPTENF
jgi:hypothetical protein